MVREPEGDVRFLIDERSRKEREEINRQIDTATSIVTGKPIKEVRNERKRE